MSDKAKERYLQLKGLKYNKKFVPEAGMELYINDDGEIHSDREIDRDDLDLIKAIEEIGEKESSGCFADLKIVNIPNNVNWYVDEYDGLETVAEKHRRWL